VRRRARRALPTAVVAAIAALGACGKKGNPLPPLQTTVAPVADFSASFVGDRVDLRFTVPAPAENNPTVLVPERIEIYRVPSPPGTPPAPMTVIGNARYLSAEIPVRRPDAPPPAPGETLRPAPGEAVSHVEPVDQAAGDGALTFVAVGVVGRNRRSPASPVATVPLEDLPAPPSDVAATNDETALRLAWQGEGPQFRVYGTAALDRSTVELLTVAPLDLRELDLPVVFGLERCFVVRSVRTSGPVTVEGLPSVPACYTAVDRYPPPPPTNLRAIQEEDAVTLTWAPVQAADLAGYIVLRGNAGGVDMQPLVREPTRDTTYRDESVQSGATYTYSVYSVDTAPAANVSPQSDRQVVTVR
jgi:hypothetical protein